MAKRKRKLPPTPPEVDVTDYRIIPILLSQYVEDLLTEGDEDIDIDTEVMLFWTLVENAFPAASKTYGTTFLLQHLKDLMTGDIGARRRAARRRLRATKAREEARRALGVELDFGEESEEEDEKALSVFKSFSGVGSGRFRQVAAMTLQDLRLVSKRYRTTADTSFKAAQFHEALAGRFADDDEESVVADHWTKTEVDDLAEQIFNN